jgi:hypothetical protein
VWSVAVVELFELAQGVEQVLLVSDQEPGPAALGRRRGGKIGPRSSGTPIVAVMPVSSWIRMVLGATDRNCRLLP